MNERDELRGTLANTICNASNYPRRASPYLLGEDMSPVLDKTADAILAAGYRKPRQVSSVEDVAALPERCIILDDMAGPLVKDGEWWRGRLTNLRHNQIILPAAVLHEPGPQP